MLWIEPVNIIYCSMMGGFIGGALTMFAQRQNHRFSLRMMEEAWNADIKTLKCRIENLDKKLSTFLVDNPVINGQEFRKNKGYKLGRPFTHGGQK